MSGTHKFRDPEAIYFITFSVIHWIDVFTRQQYRDIFVQSLKYCISKKGLDLFAWCLMYNHVHLIAKAKAGFHLENIIRDLKKYTSRQIITAIKVNRDESRKNWLIPMFLEAGKQNKKNTQYQFWQKSYHAVVLDYASIMEQKLDYLHQNPVVAGIVNYPEFYLYSSAINYIGEEGLIEVTLLE